MGPWIINPVLNGAGPKGPKAECEDSMKCHFTETILMNIQGHKCVDPTLSNFGYLSEITLLSELSPIAPYIAAVPLCRCAAVRASLLNLHIFSFDTTCLLQDICLNYKRESSRFLCFGNPGVLVYFEGC